MEYNNLDELAISSIANNLLYLTNTLQSLSLSLNQLSQLSDKWLVKLFDSISRMISLRTLKLDFQRNLELIYMSGIEKLSELINLREI